MSKPFIQPVQLIDRTLTPEQQSIREVDSKKLYLILFEGVTKDNEGKEIKTFEWAVGRQTAYDLIRDILLSSVDNSDPENPYFGEWDVMTSKIIVDSPKVSISNALSIYNFMRMSKDKQLVDDHDTSFDIDEWYYDIEEDNEGGE